MATVSRRKARVVKAVKDPQGAVQIKKGVQEGNIRIHVRLSTGEHYNVRTKDVLDFIRALHEVHGKPLATPQGEVESVSEEAVQDVPEAVEA